MSTATLFNASKNRLIQADIEGLKVVLSIGSPQGKFIKKTIPVSEWHSYLQEKVEHGYKEIEAQLAKQNIKLHPVLDNLRSISRQIVENNYKFTVCPTKESINEAKILLLELAHEKELMFFNDKLFKLFELIPRKMKNPILFTAKNEEDIPSVLERENDLLSNLETFGNEADEDENISFRDCTAEEIKVIKEHLDYMTLPLFSKAYAVSNRVSDRAFDKYKEENNIQKTSLLYHGSRNENWYSIIKTGLTCNPVNVVIAGKMFGNGIYFAPKAIKSRGYTSLSGARHANCHEKNGFIAVYEVATGKEYVSENWNTSLTLLNEKSFKEKYKCDSYHAKAGAHLLEDEVIVYNNAACKIKYLIELR